MGLDSRDHTKSSPSGSGFFYTTSFVIATKTKIWPIGQITGATGVSMHVLSAMQLLGQAPEGMQIKDAKLAGIFNMGGAAVANYVSVLEPAK